MSAAQAPSACRITSSRPPRAARLRAVRFSRRKSAELSRAGTAPGGNDTAAPGYTVPIHAALRRTGASLPPLPPPSTSIM